MQIVDRIIYPTVEMLQFTIIASERITHCNLLAISQKKNLETLYRRALAILVRSMGSET